MLGKMWEKTLGPHRVGISSLYAGEFGGANVRSGEPGIVRLGFNIWKSQISNFHPTLARLLLGIHSAPFSPTV